MFIDQQNQASQEETRSDAGGAREKLCFHQETEEASGDLGRGGTGFE